MVVFKDFTSHIHDSNLLYAALYLDRLSSSLLASNSCNQMEKSLIIPYYSTLLDKLPNQDIFLDVPSQGYWIY